MKFSKKLLTVLPVTAIGAITPMVVSSCSCSNGYTINYGDSIDCKDNKAKNYHSIDDVKNTAKNHIEIFDERKVKKDEEYALLDWNNSSNQQKFYWDLIFSTANSNIAFTLTWSLNELKTSCTGLNYNGTEYKSLSYEFNKEGVVEIKSDTGATLTTSYMYHLVTKATK